MAGKWSESRPGLFGTVRYYNEKGKMIAKSRSGLIDGTRVYTDKDGKYIGKSRLGLFGNFTYFTGIG